jgi:hypothetical protein
MSATPIPPLPNDYAPRQTPPLIASVASAITNSSGPNTSTAVASLKTNLQTAARRGADDVPAAIKTIAVMDPDYANWMQGKSALGSKTIIAPIVTHIVAWAVGYYGLSWDAETTESVAGLVSVGLMGLFHTISTTPVRSWLPQSAPPAAPALRTGA